MRLVFVFLGLFFTFTAEASKLTAIIDGDWDVDATWDSTAPGCYDTIVIPDGITVTITTQEDYESCDQMIIIIEGTLEFQSEKK